MAEYNAIAVQTVNPGETVIFSLTAVPCERGFVRHRDDSGNFLLSGWVPKKPCGCMASSAKYFIDFGANIAIPEGGTPGAISLAYILDGATLASTNMIVTPAAVEEYFNVSRATNVNVFRGCCETFAIRNTSTQPILVQDANVVITRPDLDVTY